jgi:tRNA pseudouridine32 synthase/23S rRNA pseudouridine746 synthase
VRPPALPLLLDNGVVVAVDKPAGLLTVPSRIGPADPRPCLGRLLEAQLGRRLFPLHRLDFEVSGIVLFASTPDAQRMGSLLFESRRVRKRYEALTEGAERVTELPARFRWQFRLVRGKKRSFAAPHGKLALTFAQARRRVAAAPFVAPGPVAAPAELLHFALEPQTGRPHQLRVHLASAGFPILGDALYGSPHRFARPGIALRAVRLEMLDAEAAASLQIEGPITVSGFAGTMDASRPASEAVTESGSR